MNWANGAPQRRATDQLRASLKIGVLFATLLVSGFASAQDYVVVTRDQLTWKPLIPGIEMAVVSGDPDKKGGLYVIRIRSKGEVRVPPHWHQTDEHGLIPRTCAISQRSGRVRNHHLL